MNKLTLILLVAIIAHAYSKPLLGLLELLADGLGLDDDFYPGYYGEVTKDLKFFVHFVISSTYFRRVLWKSRIYSASF